jgi:hypothetical protein
MMWLILSIGSINAFVPIAIIVILIGAAAGLTRGFDLLQILGFGAATGYARGGSKQGIVGVQRLFFNPHPIGSSGGAAAKAALGSRPNRLSRKLLGPRSALGGRTGLKRSILPPALTPKGLSRRTSANARNAASRKGPGSDKDSGTTSATSKNKNGPTLITMAVKSTGKAIGKGALATARVATGYYGGPLYALKNRQNVKKEMFKIAKSRYGLGSANSQATAFGGAAALTTAGVMQAAYNKAAKIQKSLRVRSNKPMAEMLAKHAENKSISSAKYMEPNTAGHTFVTAADVAAATAILEKQGKANDARYVRYVNRAGTETPSTKRATTEKAYAETSVENNAPIPAEISAIETRRINTFLNELEKHDPTAYDLLKADAEKILERKTSFAFTPKGSVPFRENFDKDMRETLRDVGIEDMITKLREERDKKENERNVPPDQGRNRNSDFFEKQEGESEEDFNERINNFNSAMNKVARSQLEEQLNSNPEFKEKFEELMNRNFLESAKVEGVREMDMEKMKSAFEDHIVKYSMWRDQFSADYLARNGAGAEGSNASSIHLKFAERRKEMPAPEGRLKDLAMRLKRKKLEDNAP